MIILVLTQGGKQESHGLPHGLSWQNESTFSAAGIGLMILQILYKIMHWRRRVYFEDQGKGKVIFYEFEDSYDHFSKKGLFLGHPAYSE